jgi:hypothetical protein
LAQEVNAWPRVTCAIGDQLSGHRRRREDSANHTGLAVLEDAWLKTCAACRAPRSMALMVGATGVGVARRNDETRGERRRNQLGAAPAPASGCGSAAARRGSQQFRRRRQNPLRRITPRRAGLMKGPRNEPEDFGAGRPPCGLELHPLSDTGDGLAGLFGRLRWW